MNVNNQIYISLSDEKELSENNDMAQYTGKVSQDSAEHRIENENYAEGMDFS